MTRASQASLAASSRMKAMHPKHIARHLDQAGKSNQHGSDYAIESGLAQ